MKVFIDTEFTELTQDAKLISIGMVSSNGALFYAELNDVDYSKTDQWIQDNVVKNLKFNDYSIHSITYVDTNYSTFMKGSSEDVVKEMEIWFKRLISDNYLAESTKIQIWSDCLAYDWVLFCNLYGGALNLPSFIYYIPFDICTMLELSANDPDISREGLILKSVVDGVVTYLSGYADFDDNKHNALYDACIIKECHDKLFWNFAECPKECVISDLLSTDEILEEIDKLKVGEKLHIIRELED